VSITVFMVFCVVLIRKQDAAIEDNDLYVRDPTRCITPANALTLPIRSLRSPPTASRRRPPTTA
jgi:hypothetical protein